MPFSLVVVLHTFSPSTREAKEGQSPLHREFVDSKGREIGRHTYPQYRQKSLCYLTFLCLEVKPTLEKPRTTYNLRESVAQV